MEMEIGSHRQVFREEIRTAIREAIFAGELKPGDRIIETFWAKKLNVSQGPVREAIRDLGAMGLVETVPFKGSRVRMMTGKDIRDNYGVRICLESKSIRDAISQLNDGQLKELTEHLDTVLHEMSIHAESGDVRRFTDCDTVFHRAIIDATDNPVLLNLWEQCNMRLWFTISGFDSISLGKLQVGHKTLLQAIAARDADAAVSTLEEHLTGIMQDFINSED